MDSTPLFEAFVNKVNLRLNDLFDLKVNRNKTDLFLPPFQNKIIDQARNLTLRGGKRLRAVMILCGFELFNKNPADSAALKNDALIDAACAMELMQTYLLIHDDIMDNDNTRRGGPSVHAALEKTYNDPQTGINLGILAGDLACALKEKVLCELPTDQAQKQTVQQIFSEMHIEVILGQTLDILANATPEEICQRKTASYTTCGPLGIGAALGGAKHCDQAQLAQISIPLGLAFQLQDDLIGVFGDKKNTGKPIGTDLVEGKQTFLTQQALLMATDSQRLAIKAVLNNAAANSNAITEATQALIDCGAKRICEHKITALVQQAFETLEKAPYTNKGKIHLKNLSLRLVNRDA